MDVFRRLMGVGDAGALLSLAGYSTASAKAAVTIHTGLDLEVSA